MKIQRWQEDSKGGAKLLSQMFVCTVASEQPRGVLLFFSWSMGCQTSLIVLVVCSSYICRIIIMYLSYTCHILVVYSYTLVFQLISERSDKSYSTHCIIIVYSLYIRRILFVYSLNTLVFQLISERSDKFYSTHCIVLIVYSSYSTCRILVLYSPYTHCILAYSCFSADLWAVRQVL